MFETQSQRGAYIVSTSKPIPAKGSDEDASPQPPHRQAAAHHRRVVRAKDGTFLVTMENPREAAPKPARFEVTRFKIALIMAAPSVIASASSAPARAG